MSGRPVDVQTPDEPDLLDIETEVAEIAGSLNLMNSRPVAVTERVLEHGDCIGNRIHSPSQWLAWKAGISPSHAKQVVKVAAQRASYPLVIDAFDRGQSAVEGAIGEVVGKLYVQRHFPASSKVRMIALVENLVEAYRRSVTDLEWMSPTTRERALVKLSRFTPKIGYPDKWKDYSALQIRTDDLLGNMARSSAWRHDVEFAKIGLFGWAQIWRAVTGDAHSPKEVRCNAVVSNLDAFHEAFDVQESDALFTRPDRRVRIW